MRAVGLPPARAAPGAAHPAVYGVAFDCALRRRSTRASSRTTSSTGRRSGSAAGGFLNLMTARLEAVEAELADLAARRIQAGEWPWSFFCYPEERPRPVFPSSFFLLAPGGGGERRARRALPGLRTASRSTSSRTSTSTCRSTTTREIGVVEHVFAGDARATVEEFRAELYSGRFDARRLTLLARFDFRGNGVRTGAEVVPCTA